MIYADTSFIAKIFWKEEESSHAFSILKKNPHSLIWTEFHALELSNAISLKVFRKEITAGDEAKIRDQIEIDLLEKKLLSQPIDWNLLLRDAQKISTRNTSSSGTRTLDILHIACALYLKAPLFLTYDQRQLSLARKLGLKSL